MEIGTFYGIGLGPGDPDLVTLKALKALQKADRIYTVLSRNAEQSVSDSIVRALPGIGAEPIPLEFTMSRSWDERLRKIGEHADSIAAELRKGLNCAFTTIGDPMTYSTCSYLLKALKQRIPDLKSEIVPGVNSWSALAASVQKPLAEDTEILRIIPSFIAGDPEFPENTTSILLKTYHTRDELLRKIPADAEVWYGANLGLANETAASDRDRIGTLPEAYLSMLAVKRGKRS